MVKFHVCLGNSQTAGLKNFWSYPVKTHYIHKGKYYLMTNSVSTDESSLSSYDYLGFHYWHQLNILLWNL